MIKRILILALALCLSVMCVPTFNNVNAEGFYCDTIYNESDSNGYVDITLEFEYDTYTVTDILLDKLCPNYSNNMTTTNSCAPVAGTIVIGYYDDVYTELIPNFTPTYTYNGVLLFRTQNTYVMAVKDELYELMGTNTVNAGTSVSQFKSGLTSYVNQCGYNITISSCGNRINTTTAISYIEQEQPIVMFISSYYYYPLGGISIEEEVVSMVGWYRPNGAHVVVALGYREYQFTKNGTVNTQKFMIVSFGDGSQGLIPVNDTSIVDESYAINVYA